MPSDKLQKVLSAMIAYCYQELPLVQRFVFMRMILTYLDRNRALPQKDMALVLGLSHIYYRVLCNRVKSFAVKTNSLSLLPKSLTAYFQWTGFCNCEKAIWMQQSIQITTSNILFIVCVFFNYRFDSDLGRYDSFPLEGHYGSKMFVARRVSDFFFAI